MFYLLFLGLRANQVLFKDSISFSCKFLSASLLCLFFRIKCKHQTMIRKFTREVTVHLSCGTGRTSKQRIKMMINERTISLM